MTDQEAAVFVANEDFDLAWCWLRQALTYDGDNKCTEP